MIHHRPLAGVVGGRRERKVAAEALDQPTQVTHTAIDVLPGIERVPDAEHRRGPGHELHETACSLA